MKYITIAVFICVALIDLGCIAQTSSSKDSAIAMLQTYYTNHRDIWLTMTPFENEQFYTRIDSLQKQYCTTKLYNESKKLLQNGSDLLTNDYGMDELVLKSAISIKATNEPSQYSITYDVNTYPVSPNTPVVKKISFKVRVIQENNSFKIADVN